MGFEGVLSLSLQPMGPDMSIIPSGLEPKAVLFVPASHGARECPCLWNQCQILEMTVFQTEL